MLDQKQLQTHTSTDRHVNNHAHMQHSRAEGYAQTFADINKMRLISTQVSLPVFVECLLAALLLHLELLYSALQQACLSAELSRELLLDRRGHLVIPAICAVEEQGVLGNYYSWAASV